MDNYKGLSRILCYKVAKECIMKQKTKLIIILIVEFLAITAMLLLIFFAGKRSYNVTFDLNGGTLISGETTQRVTQGQNASPPQVVKDGCYFLQWSGSYKQITKDVELKAIWEYETTPGIEYAMTADSNYCEISGAYKGLTGDVYIGAYHNNKKVLGIQDGAFKDCNRITSIYLLDGILDIGDSAFEGCSAMTSIEIPSTVKTLGDNVFKDCVSLEKILLPEGLISIGEHAFDGCSSLLEIILPNSVQAIGVNAFTVAEMVVYAYIKESEQPALWLDGWYTSDIEVVWEYVESVDEDVDEANNEKD